MGSDPDADGREPGGSGLVGRSIDEFVNQLRGFTERARSMAGSVPSRLSLPALPSPPGAMSAAQLRAIAQTVTAQRQSIQATIAQLQAFDQQLAVFERILEPLVDWSSTWAQLERAVGDFVRPERPATGTSGGPASGTRSSGERGRGGKPEAAPED